MPLLAIDTDREDRVIDLTCVDDSVWFGIWRTTTGDRLRCRGCDQPLHAKRRIDTGLRFFAHSVLVPGCPSHGESARHLALKARFAAAFRAAGWCAELEVAGDGWRADVLTWDGGAKRLAIEIQLASITRDEVEERMSRHRASGVETLWVTAGVRPHWAKEFATVLVDPSDRIVTTVVVPADEPAEAPVLAGPGTPELFAKRWVQRRMSGVPGRSDWSGRGGGARVSPAMFQLDSCATTYLEHLARQQAAEEAKLVAVTEEQRRAAAARTALTRPMAASLQDFAEWFSSQPTEWRCWFGRTHASDWGRAVEDPDWDLEVGIVICVGWRGPTHVLALAEPHQSSPTRDKRVAAWISGADPAADAAGFATVLTPECRLDLGALDLKPMSRGWRRW